jgi:hypothetical protein
MPSAAPLPRCTRAWARCVLSCWPPLLDWWASHVSGGRTCTPAHAGVYCARCGGQLRGEGIPGPINPVRLNLNTGDASGTATELEGMLQRAGITAGVSSARPLAPGLVQTLRVYKLRL